MCNVYGSYAVREVSVKHLVFMCLYVIHIALLGLALSVGGCSRVVHTGVLRCISNA